VEDELKFDVARGQWRRFAALLFFCTFAMLSMAQPAEKQDELAEWIKANYTKYEYRIPMRDGIHLFTSVYVPKDAAEQRTYPILFDRTPYTVAPYGADQYKNSLGPSDLFARSKYIFVYQDVRGKFLSEGTFEDMRPYIANKRNSHDIDESSDTYDTIDWLVKNIRYNNGRVGVWGISYPGFYSVMAALDAHPALKAVSPQAPIADWFIGDDFHHNGALYLPHMYGFMYTFGQPRPEPTTQWAPRFEHDTPDGYEFYLNNTEPLSNIDTRFYHNKVAWWDEIIQHPNYDQFWKARSTPQFLRNIKPAMLTVGGWFDAEDLWGALHTYKAASEQSPGGEVKLVMGPWFHGGWARVDGDHLGNVWFNGKQSIFYREKIEFPFFEHHLKDAPDPQLPEAYVFETGTNEWKRYDTWPPKQAKPAVLYLGPNGQLSFTPPAAGADFDEYVSDPSKPVPFLSTIDFGMTREHMTDDQRQAARRPDVLVYQTAPLTQDVTIAGPLKPELFVSTSGTDSDFVVKLIDVYPDNFPDNPENPKDVHLGAYEQLIRGELFRGRFRNSYEKPEAFEPNKVTKIAYEMPDVNHTFRRGHRIMVQVQSTWFPLVDLNPQKFVPNIYNAKPSDFQKATERVYHSGPNQSHINVLLLPN
jgi:putative CocE/NonD family hydrolase